MARLTGTCALCLERRELRASHIVPAFVTRGLRKTSATGHLRIAAAPNVRRQDMPRIALLCAECENKFARWEEAFASEIFIPFQRERVDWEFKYDGWLLNFAQSLAWRALQVEKDQIISRCPALQQPLSNASEEWRRRLLGEQSDDEPYAHHVFFFPYMSRANCAKLPDGFNDYLHRSVDCAIAHSATQVSAYTKLPGIVFWSGITPPNPRGWTNTQVLRQGVLKPPQGLSDRDFMAFLGGQSQADAARDI